MNISHSSFNKDNLYSNINPYKYNIYIKFLSINLSKFYQSILSILPGYILYNYRGFDIFKILHFNNLTVK